MFRTTGLTINKHQLTLILIFVLSLLATQCGGAATPAPAQKEVVRFEPEKVPETKLIATEDIPLNNCNGNSALRMDIERSREFVYTVIDKNGSKFGGEYIFLTGLLEHEYSVVDGEKETQTHTLHLETKANSYVIYTIAWKESWLNGNVVISNNERASEISYRIKKGLVLEVQTVEEVSCK